jgi:hypothetical protein
MDEEIMFCGVAVETLSRKQALRQASLVPAMSWAGTKGLTTSP